MNNHEFQRHTFLSKNILVNKKFNNRQKAAKLSEKRIPLIVKLTNQNTRNLQPTSQKYE